MVTKKILRVSKLEFVGGQAKPGPTLASLNINMPQFCVKFNDATKDRKGEVVPVIITSFVDKSFDFVLKTTPTPILLKKEAGIEKGSANAKTIVGKISLAAAKKIAAYKLPDLNAYNEQDALKIIAGTAKNMGIKIEGYSD